MNPEYYARLAEAGLDGQDLPDETCREILRSPDIELLPLLAAAYTIRKRFWGNDVTVHIINNAQNGHCPEDCHYCAQAKSSQADILEYPLKTDEEIFAEAQNAYESGAFRYCMVFAGRGPSKKRVEHLARLVREIKSRYPIEICVSTGLLDKGKADILKDAGLDRLNHNLNTSEDNYPNICTTHTYQDRINTLTAARQAGVQLCSGLIIGMGEQDTDIIEIAKTLRGLKAESIPVNFLIPIEGTAITQNAALTPDYCLRVLCLFRFLNPSAEIRMAAGREVHLRSMEVLGLYPASSLFLQGYLNTKGSSRGKTLRMIRDAGFQIRSAQNLDELIEKEENPETGEDGLSFPGMKDIQDLRPYRPQSAERTSSAARDKCC
ncbi:MAG: biotin synthase BioB [Candidatus Omnitrophota bacterium]|nr:biotin synthase BioB [Candidatus Omnitrophota bacterium]MDZ4241982.1 biotin synthase BioB [Candidatus Omnitrophota bacterium]